MNEVSSKSNLFKSTWSGEQPLVITYWLFGVAGTLIVYGIASALLETIDDWQFKLTCLILIVCYQIFVSVSVWRSSKKYTGKRSFAALAQFAIFLGWFGATPQIIMTAIYIISQ
jgi:ABC-type transport system involved in Fe-S cluster assembly fused permease/ATPase subunit